MMDRCATQILFEKAVPVACVTNGVRSCLVGKGCLFHVEVEANAIEAVPSTDGRGPRDTRTALNSRTEPSPQGCADPAGHSRREGNGSRRGAVDACGCTGPVALNVVGTNGDVVHRGNRHVAGIDRHDHRGRGDHDVDPAGRTVYPNPDTHNAKVFFQNLIVTPTGELGKIDVGQVSNFRTVQNGILAIDMPNFYLAHTETTKPSCRIADSTSAMSAGEILHPAGRDHASLRRRRRQLHAARRSRR